MKIELVQIDDQYAIRKSTWYGKIEYLDLVAPRFWWSRHTSNFKDCLGTKSEAELAAKKILAELAAKKILDEKQVVVIKRLK